MTMVVYRLRRGWTALLFVLFAGVSCSTAFTVATVPAKPSPNNHGNNDSHQIVILGGAGRIGSAVAIHLLERHATCNVILVGRRQSQIDAAIQEVIAESTKSTSTNQQRRRVSGYQIDSVWDESCSKYQALVDSADCLIHTAGPYLDEKPVPLMMALKSSRCKSYVDVSDPLSYLEQSILMWDEAVQSNLTALVAAGAFPGMSNVLAKEASVALDARVQDVRFNYFTAGLGGSGVVNLYITNLGFGEPMVQYDQGKLRWFMELSGLLLGKIDFFLDNLPNHPGNELAEERVGRQTVFAWPFPEAATVPKNLNLLGNSYAAMGTAPDLWNSMLGILVNIVPRPFWRNAKFSKFMADFSQPLVLATDALMKQTGTGETHAMRIDVSSIASPRETSKGVSIIQAHDSFRKCVGQSCAEFALDILRDDNDTNKHGVYLPEQYYEDDQDRRRIIEKLTRTPGTFCYTGPVRSDIAPDTPSGFDQAISQANIAESAASK